jgi:CheY-like chemotaxis protein
MREQASVLIIDDDPTHQKIYGWIVECAGYRALLAEVRFEGVRLPEEAADMILLDYHLKCQTSAALVAERIRSSQPGIPIVVLSDAWSLPDDIAPLVQGFVRKGDPAELIAMLQQLLQPSAVQNS